MYWIKTIEKMYFTTKNTYISWDNALFSSLIAADELNKDDQMDTLIAILFLHYYR